MITLQLSAPFQTDFSIQTNCNQLSHALFLKHGRYITASDEPKGKKLIAIRENNRYRIEFGGNVTDSSNPLSEIDHILCENTHYDETVFALHGAAVGYKGKAYLFLASTTGGQDDACQLLIQLGFDYITDDCICLTRRALLYIPTIAILCREGGFRSYRGYMPSLRALNGLKTAETSDTAYTPGQIAPMAGAPCGIFSPEDGVGKPAMECPPPKR